jgi:hypothetical protein
MAVAAALLFPNSTGCTASTPSAHPRGYSGMFFFTRGFLCSTKKED